MRRNGAEDVLSADRGREVCQARWGCVLLWREEMGGVGEQKQRERILVSRDNRRRGANQPRIRKAASRCSRVDDDASRDLFVREINLRARSCLMRYISL